MAVTASKPDGSGHLAAELQAVASPHEARVTPEERQPRVLLVAPQPFYEDRGTPIAVRQVLLALSELGYQVDLLTYPVGSSPDIPGVSYHRVANPLGIRAVPIGFSLRKVWLDVFIYFAMRRLLGRGGYAWVHAVEEAAFLAVLAARHTNTPVIYDMQSSLPEQLARHPLLGLRPLRWLARACDRWLVRRADRIVASAGLANRVLRLAPGAWVREWHFSSTVELVCDASQTRSQLRVDPRQRIVLYTGNFEDYQGLSLLVSSMPIIRARIPDAVFVLVGANGHHTTRVKQQLAELLPEDAYRLVSRQPREAIPEFLALADVVVSPRTRGSNLPIKVLEYLAAGRAIVATAIPAHRSILDDEIALLVQPRSEALAAAIIHLLESPVALSNLQISARSYAERNLSWRAFLQEVAHIYDSAQKDGQAPAASLRDHSSAELAVTHR